MRKLVWAIVGLALIVWSGLAWVIHGLIGYGGGLAANNVDVVTNVPETVEWLNWIALFGTGLGEWLVIGIWALGTLALLALGLAGNVIVRRFFSARGEITQMRPAP